MDSRPLPPGQQLAARGKWPQVGEATPSDLPPDAAATWQIDVAGLIAAPRSWSLDDLRRLPRAESPIDIHCVTRWSKFDTVWEGVAVATLIKEGLIRPRPEAKFVIQHCEYGYTTNTPIEFVLQDGFILATHYDGQPLTPDHGYPLRGVAGVVPGRRNDDKYFWKGGKWLRGLEFRADDKPGFWERNGYHNQADVWREQRHSWPGF